MFIYLNDQFFLKNGTYVFRKIKKKLIPKAVKK